jgi:hypothetical protein
MIDIGSAAIGHGERGRAQHGQLTSQLHESIFDLTLVAADARLPVIAFGLGGLARRLRLVGEHDRGCRGVGDRDVVVAVGLRHLSGERAAHGYPV